MRLFDGYRGLSLRGGFLVKSVQARGAPMVDALGRPAAARTVIVGTVFEIGLDARLPEEEISVSLCHEVLEAAASPLPSHRPQCAPSTKRVSSRRRVKCTSDWDRLHLPPSIECWSFSAFDVIFSTMNDDIRVELLKLAGGERLFRLEHPPSGLCLEKRLDPESSVVGQTGRWRQVFASLLESESIPA